MAEQTHASELMKTDSTFKGYYAPSMAALNEKLSASAEKHEKTMNELRQIFRTLMVQQSEGLHIQGHQAHDQAATYQMSISLLDSDRNSRNGSCDHYLEVANTPKEDANTLKEDEMEISDVHFQGEELCHQGFVKLQQIEGMELSIQFVGELKTDLQCQVNVPYPNAPHEACKSDKLQESVVAATIGYNSIDIGGVSRHLLRIGSLDDVKENREEANWDSISDVLPNEDDPLPYDFIIQNNEDECMVSSSGIEFSISFVEPEPPPLEPSSKETTSLVPHNSKKTNRPESLESESEFQIYMNVLMNLVVEMEELLNGKHKHIEEMQDTVLRNFTKMENVMDETRREAENANKYVVKSFGEGLPDVGDKLVRVSYAVKESSNKINTSKDSTNIVPQLKTLLEGVEMSEKHILEVFKQIGVENYERPGIVAAILLGYMLYDIVVQLVEVEVTKEETTSMFVLMFVDLKTYNVALLKAVERTWQVVFGHLQTP